MIKRRLHIRTKTILAVSMLTFVLVMTIFAPVLAPYDPYEVDILNSLAKPSAEHPLGTDDIGRDVLTRVMYGGRQSIVLALAATVASMCLGCMIGLLAGYFGGAVDIVITSVSNIFQGLPGMTMMIAVAGMMGSGVKSMIAATVINSWVGFSRLIRGEVMRIKQESFVEGVRSIGAGDFRILLCHIAPNLLGTIAVMFATRIAGVILNVSALSFLGLGLQPPTPDWGVMISDARAYFRKAPVLVLAPGACIMMISLGVNLLADVLRDHFDVRKDSIRNM